MSSSLKTSKNKLIAKTIFFGAVTAAIYAAAFSNADLLMSVFTRGGYYAAFPIATVFAVSFAHGSFSNSLWSMLGVEAVTKQTQPRAEKAGKRPSQRQRPRLRMSV